MRNITLEPDFQTILNFPVFLNGQTFWMQLLEVPVNVMQVFDDKISSEKVEEELKRVGFNYVWENKVVVKERKRPVIVNSPRCNSIVAGVTTTGTQYTYPNFNLEIEYVSDGPMLMFYAGSVPELIKNMGDICE